MSEEIQDKESAAYGQMIGKNLRDFDSVTDIILQTTKEDRRKLLEPVFKNELLPIVRAWLGNKPTDIRLWINIAGADTNPIDVIDTTGEVIFTLPAPYVDVAALEYASEGRITTEHHLIDQQVTMVKNGDTRGVMKVENALVDILKPTPEVEKKAFALLGFVPMYRHYDLPMEELLGPAHAEILESILGNVPAATSQPDALEGDEGGAAEDEFIY